MRIRIIRTKKPLGRDVDAELEWLCSSLGFCEQIDKDKTASAIFRKLLENTHRREPMRSDDIADSIGKSRGAVVNHLNKLMGAGLVVRRGTRYELREENLHNTLMEMRRDMERMFADMEEIAREIDREMDGRRG
jgi:predicted transcriptional regulator